MLNLRADLGLTLVRLGQFLHRGQQCGLQVQNALTRTETDFEFLRVKGLSEIIIRPGFQPGNDILLLIFRGQQNEVHVGGTVPLTDLAADFHPIHTRHKPIEDSQTRRVSTLQELPCLDPIVGHDDLMPGLVQGRLQKPARDNIIVGNENFHVTY